MKPEILPYILFKYLAFFVFLQLGFFSPMALSQDLQAQKQELQEKKLELGAHQRALEGALAGHQQLVNDLRNTKNPDDIKKLKSELERKSGEIHRLGEEVDRLQEAYTSEQKKLDSIEQHK
jgi:chromosome segregation ATPase